MHVFQLNFALHITAVNPLREDIILTSLKTCIFHHLSQLSAAPAEDTFDHP
jgi:hypothetical protein